jgi:hypothetical protein
MVLIGFHMTLIRHVDMGPMSGVADIAEKCQDSWWKNILYINNFGDGNGENFADVRFSVLVFKTYSNKSLVTRLLVLVYWTNMVPGQ